MIRLAVLGLLLVAATTAMPLPPIAHVAGADGLAEAHVALAVPPAATGSPDVVVAARWSWPVPPPRTIARPFIAPATRFSAGHRGIDVRTVAPVVLAPADGIVHFAGVVVDRPVLSIRHSGGLISSYEPVATTLAAGDAVTRGDEIGTLVPGHCAVPCLHFGVRLHGEYVNPLLYLGGVPRSVLLPTR